MVMHVVPVAELATSSMKRFEFLAEFVGFGPADWAAIEESAAVIGPKLPGILDALYDHLLSFDDTRRLFLGERGDLDPAYIVLRKEHLTDWVLRIVDGRNDVGALVEYLEQVGRRHTGAVETWRAVPPRYIVGLTSFVQTALTSAAFDAVGHDLPTCRRVTLAWNKFLILQVELFLKVLAPRWPQWDEPHAR